MMNRFCVWHRPHLYGSIFFSLKENVYDTLEDPPEFVPKTGLERVYKAFGEEQPGCPSKALISLSQFVGASFIVGFLVGGFKKGNRAHGHFIMANQHVKFISPYEAKRKLQDTVVLAFLQGGVFWGFKAAMFTGIYSFCVIAIPVFRDTKEGILEYTIGGALAGGLSRLYLGIRAAFAGATIVGACASVIGIITYLSSTPMSEIRDAQYSVYEWRRKLIESSAKRINRNPFGHELNDIVSMRERRHEKSETSGYSASDTVFVVMPSPNEVSQSTEPAKGTAETKESNEQQNTSVAAVVTK